MTQASTENDQPLERGSITFVQHHIPPLQSGEYVLTVEQEISFTQVDGQGTATKIDDLFTNTHRFAVRGERFSLDPKEIDSVFPPNNNQGDYVSVLPHVVC